MAKNSHSGFFGIPPPVNFFSSVDDDTVEVDKDALQRELSEKMERQAVTEDEQEDGNLHNWTLSEFYRRGSSKLILMNFET